MNFDLQLDIDDDVLSFDENDIEETFNDENIADDLPVDIISENKQKKKVKSIIISREQKKYNEQLTSIDNRQMIKDVIVDLFNRCLICSMEQKDNELVHFIDKYINIRKIDKYKKLIPIIIAERIEQSCYNRTIAECKRDGVDRFWINKIFKNRYVNICNRIISNLNPDGIVNSTNDNPFYTFELIISLNSQYECKNRRKLTNIAYLTSYELNPQCNAIEINDINERKKIKLKEKVSKTIKCPVCGEKKTTYEEVQKRAADEPSTTVYKCTHCLHKW